MCLAINYFSAKGWFRLELSNFRLNDIKFLKEDTVFIPCIKKGKKKKLTGSASQMRRHVLVFPAVVADLVKDFNDTVWRLILHLRTVCSLVCAPALSMGQVAELSVEIHSYITIRIE